MAARTSETERPGAETGNPTQFSAEQEGGGSLRARYPIVALSYDQDASRLVMLFRDPATGDAVAQIPSKVVVRQYREAQSEKERDERRKFEVIVGGAAGESQSIGEKLAGANSSSAAAAGKAATSGAAASSVGSASAPVSVASAAASVAAAAPSGVSGGSSSASSGLNLVV